MTAAKTPAILAAWTRDESLCRGVLLKRYKRFLADVHLDSGEIVTTHCVNTGAMEGLTQPGTPVWLSRNDNPKRKLRYTWELAQVGDAILGVNTNLPNKLVARLLAERRLPWLAEFPDVRAEMKYGHKSRVDFFLSGGDRSHYLEVKNCHLLYPDGMAYFPDCVSVRAAGHLHELSHCLANDRFVVTAEVLFVVQIDGANGVRPSDLHDPVFAAAARAAARRGVQFSAIGVAHTQEQVTIYGPIPVDLAPYETAMHAQWRDANREADRAEAGLELK